MPPFIGKGVYPVNQDDCADGNRRLSDRVVSVLEVTEDCSNLAQTYYRCACIGIYCEHLLGTLLTCEDD
jgi:hypothetical protein